MKPNESPASSAPEAASPFPPPFRWEAPPPEAAPQVTVPPPDPLAWPGEAERTQVLRSAPSYQQHHPDQVRDLFQPVEPALEGPSDVSAPPWATAQSSPNPGPISDEQSAGLGQAFRGPAPQSRSKQIIGITVLVVVVMGLLGATVAYVMTAGPGRIGDDQIGASQPVHALPAPPAPLPAPEDTAHALIDPPGQTRAGGGLFDLPQMEATSLLRPPILTALHAGGMTDAVLKTTVKGTATIGMFAFALPDEQAATTVAQAIVDEQHDGGLKADNNRALQGVAVMGSDPGATEPAYRAVYVLYHWAIFVEVYGPNRADVLTTFDSLLKEQVTHAPPTVRAGR